MKMPICTVEMYPFTELITIPFCGNKIDLYRNIFSLIFSDQKFKVKVVARRNIPFKHYKMLQDEQSV